MSNYKIIFLDIDGTVLKPDDQIDYSTKTAIAIAQQKGIEVFLATGRPLHEISDIAEELKIQSYIGYNGAYAVHNGKDILNVPMKTSTVKSFVTIAKKLKNEIVLYSRKENLFTSMEDADVQTFMNIFHMKKNKLYSSENLDPILGITLIKLNENDPPLYEKDESIHLSRVNLNGLNNCYDVIQDTVNKGFAVTKVLEYLNIKKEDAIAFGDGMNDKEMLSAVGEGFAMGNADPKLFAYAKHRTTEVTNSGIFNGLKTLGILNEINSTSDYLTALVEKD